MESPSTFQYTCFHLEHKGERINDHVEFSEVNGLAADSELKLIEDPYTEKEARTHLIRIREIIGAAGNRTDTLHGISAGLSLYDRVLPWKDPKASPAPAEKATNGNLVGTTNALADYSFEGAPSISTLLPLVQEQSPKTTKSISLSPWNPPPPLLRLQGHLLYIQLTTNEGEQYQVTSQISGFFVNKSSNSKFDPFPRPAPKSASAHSLLSLISNVSASFSTTFEKLLEYNNKRDPLANLQLTNAIPSSPWAVAPGLTSLSAQQSDLTRTQETYLMSGVENVENLRDWNEEIQTTQGGDDAARVAVGKDVSGVKAVNQLDIAGLASPGTIVVDYLGKRIVAQSLIPGIFKQREPDEHQVDYGGVEGKDTVAENQSLTPLDITWIEDYWSDSAADRATTDKTYPHRMAVLRPELVEAYWTLNMDAYVKAEYEKRKSGSASAQMESLSNKAESGLNSSQIIESSPANTEETTASTNGEHESLTNGANFDNAGLSLGGKGEITEQKVDQERVDISAFSLALNPDVFCGQEPQTNEEKEEWAKDEQEVRLVCDFLHQKILPEMIHHLKEESHVSEDIQDLYKEADYSFTRATPRSLKSDIESQVKLRYRHVLEERWLDEIKHLQLLRSIALKLGLQLNAKEYSFTAETHVANGEVKAMTNGGVAHAETNGHINGNAGGKKRKKHGGRASPSAVNDSELPRQLVTFHPEDIVNLVPIIKDACPKSVLAEEALEAGKNSMMQNQTQIGQDLLLESMTLHEQIYGILHPEVARVYHQLAMLYYQLDEKDAAIQLAQKAVIISERTLGIDSSETILSYLNLALFEHANRNTSVALSCVRHALELWKVIYGPNHPDSITTLNNAAVMLQQLQLYSESRQWFEMSLQISEEVSGKQSVNTATLLFQLAQALVLDQDHKGAVHRIREAYNIFLAKLGAEDPNTKESEKWLEQLTQNAVSVAKHAKDVQARRVRRVLFNPKITTMGARPQPQVGQSTADMVNGHDSGSRAFDARSIDELINFIEGGADHPKPSTTKKRAARGNPRHRGGKAAVA
ncbi:protein TIF31, partial [Lecanoromycetidae sp. Uapishka_2]